LEFCELDENWVELELVVGEVGEREDLPHPAKKMKNTPKAKNTRMGRFIG
jgi:hypothetical protein